MAEGDEKSGGERIELAQAGPPDGAGEVHKRSRFERKEVLCDMDVNWDDQYLLEFAKDYPDVMKQHTDEVSKVACMDKSTPEYVTAKASLFEKIIGNLQWRIRREHMIQQRVESALRIPTDSVSRRKLHDQLIDSRYRTEDYEKFKGNLVLYKEAYGRFASDRKRIETRLLTGIKSGEIHVPNDFPYVMFVNKNDTKQYAAIYKYNKTTGKLSFKTCNLVSTGDNVRWLEEEPDGGHKTPSRTFYIGEIRGLNHRSLDDDGEVYGAKFVDKDREPYQTFRLYRKSGIDYSRTSFLLHPTWEEPLLGTTASHGCVRVSRIMDLQLVKIYDEWYRAHGVTDFAKFPPVELCTDNPKMPVVVDEI